MNNSYKKTFYRATHRGTKELDLVMMQFMDTGFHTLTQEQMHEFKKIINEDDHNLLSWMKNLKKKETVDNM